MRKPLFLVVGVLLMASTVLSACAPAATPTAVPQPAQASAPAATTAPQPAAKQDVTLKVMSFLAIDTPDVEKQIIAEFEKENPGIKVQFDAVPFGDFFTKLQTMIAGGTPPDVASLNMENLQSFAALGALADLGPLVQKDNYDLGQYYPATLDMHSYKGKLYGLPASFSTVVLFYNKKLFDEAQVPYPDGTWTWDKMIDAAKKLTKDTNGDGKIDQFGYAKAWWPVYLWLNGADLFNKERTKCTIAEPAAVEGIQKMVDLWLVHKVAPTPADLKTQSDWDMFMAGRLAMYPVGPWGIAPFQKISTFEWDIADHPAGKEKATFLFGNSLTILAASKNQEAAWKYLKFAAGEKGERIRQQGGYEIAPVKKVAESEFLQSLKGKMPAHAEVFLNSTAYARTVPVVPKWNEISAAIDEQLELASLGKKPVKDALTDAAAKVDAILATIK